MIKYILELKADEYEAREMLLENDVPEEEINEQEIDRTINNLNDMTVDDFYYSFPEMITREGYTVAHGRLGCWMILLGESNSLVAEVSTDFTWDNHLEITVDTSNSITDSVEDVHKVLLELTSKEL